MAKNLTVTWLGDEDPDQQVISHGGITFAKGEAVPVPVTHALAPMLKDNPMFAVDEDAEVVDAGEAEKDALRDQLDAKGIKYRANASADALRGLLAENTETGVGAPPVEPPTATVTQ